ncbi:hypothetical protein [Nocardia jiangxiensis]|uniref:Immunity protein 8 n=1 Tax=Nocardia jiangxiensis TaxID=282685 RepID=A0ABW6S1X6_9NOCA|nr:hypothetical protein [Nocardia jiangxiensis]
MTPETLDRVVATVRRVVDEHVADRDLFAWRFTLPVDADQPTHAVLETQWRLDNPDEDPGDRRTYEIALSLVGDAKLLTETNLAQLERRLMLCISAQDAVPYEIHTLHRESFDLEENRELI